MNVTVIRSFSQKLETNHWNIGLLVVVAEMWSHWKPCATEVWNAQTGKTRPTRSALANGLKDHPVIQTIVGTADIVMTKSGIGVCVKEVT